MRFPIIALVSMLLLPLSASESPPLPPDALRFERVSVSEIDLFWEPSGMDSSVTQYEVWRTSVEVGRGVDAAVLIAEVSPDDELKYSDGGVIFMGTYVYHVVAVGPGGRSLPSIPVVIGPAAYPPCTILLVSYDPPDYDLHPECAVP